MSVARRAPVQGDYDRALRRYVGAGSITWEEHVEAWTDYARVHGGQSAARIAERGGFGYQELIHHLGRKPTTWTEEQP